MYSVSERWDAEIRAGGIRKTVCDFYYGTGDGVLVYEDIPVSDFEVRVDRKSQNRRTGSLTLVQPEMLERLVVNPGVTPIEPYGGEFVLRSGVVYEDNTEELIPLGRFTVENLEWSEPGESMTVDLFDRSKIFSRTTHWFAPNRRTVVASIEWLVDQLTPPLKAGVLTVDPAVIAKDYQFPAGVLYEGDSWKIMNDLCSTVGAEPYFDVTGQLQVKPVTHITQPYNLATAAWVIDTGEQGNMVEVSRKVSRTDTFNVVTIFGTPPNGTTAQPSAFAADDNPASPTYWKGPFGRSDTFEERAELFTYAACKQVAEARLNTSKGLSRTINLEVLSNPALDVNDALVVEFPSGVTEVHVIDGLTINLSGSMTIDTRLQFTV